MKRLRICLEIQGLAEDEQGNLCAGGVCLSLGDADDDKYDAAYEHIVNSIDIEDILTLVGLKGEFTAADCRIITPEEYDRKYSDDEDEQ